MKSEIKTQFSYAARSDFLISQDDRYLLFDNIPYCSALEVYSLGGVPGST